MSSKRKKAKKQKDVSKIFTCLVCEKSYLNQYHLERHSYTHQKNVRKNEDQIQYDNPAISKMIEIVLSSRKERKALYKCELCGDTFTEKMYFILHLVKFEGIRPYKCSICEKRFYDQKTVTDHTRTHTANEGPKTLSDPKEPDSLACKFCFKQFAKKRYLSDHENTHIDRKPYVCHICSKGFSQSANCRRHIRLHKGLTHHADGSTSVSAVGDRFQCDLCDKSYSQKIKLKEHRASHSQDLSVTCKHCKKSFSCAYSRDRHIIESHERVKLHTCKICGKNFSRINQLNEHIEAFHGKQELYKCNICGKAFSNKINTKIHYQNVHKYSKPKYCCDICDQGFFHSIEYKRHQIKCIADAKENAKQKLVFSKLTEEDYFQELEDRRAIFSCMCGLSFTDKSLYFIHSSSHSFPDGKQCAFCNYSTTGWCHFFAHLMDHSK